MAEGKTFWIPEGLQPALDQLAGAAAASDAARLAGAAGVAATWDPASDIPMMAPSPTPSPTRPWWKPVLVLAGSLALGWAGWRLWTTGDPRALLPWPSGQRAGFGGGPFGGAAAMPSSALMPGPDYGDDCGCGG